MTNATTISRQEGGFKPSALLVGSWPKTGPQSMTGDLRLEQSGRSVILPAFAAEPDTQLCGRYHGVANTPGVGLWPEI